MSGLKGKTIYVDANIFIYLFEENPEFISIVGKLFEEIFQKNIKIASSIISLTEILSFPDYSINKFTLLKNLYYQTPNLTSVDVNGEIAERAAVLRRKYNLRLPDSLHLATAILSKCDLFLTNDKQLKKCKEIKVLTLDKLKDKNVGR